MNTHPALQTYLRMVTSRPEAKDLPADVPIKLENEILSKQGGQASITVYRTDAQTFTFRVEVQDRNGNQAQTFVQCMGAQTKIHICSGNMETRIVNLEQLDDPAYWGEGFRPLTRALLLPLKKLLSSTKAAA
jgi:hypothetical protein